MSRLRTIYPGLLLVGLSVLLWLPRLQGPIDLHFDAGVYYILGTSLAEGKGYRLLNEPGEIEAVQYPPLLPLFVAAHQRVLGTADPGTVGQALRWSYFLLFTLYVLATYALARQHVEPCYALLVAVIGALSLQCIYLSDLLFAEIPFALVTALFGIFHRKCGRAPYFFLTGGTAVAAFLLRTAGAALLAAWVAESLVKREWKQFFGRAGVAAVPVLGWQAYIYHVTAGEEYRNPAYAYQRADYQYYNVTYAENIGLVDTFAPEQGRVSAAGLARRFGVNLLTLSTRLGEGVVLSRGLAKGLVDAVRDRTGITLPLALVLAPITAVGGVIVVGAGVFVARRDWFIPLYLAASAGLICLTPWPQQFPRYLAPLAPFLALCLVVALRALRAYTQRKGSRRWRWAGNTCFAVVIGLVLVTDATADVHAYLFRHRVVRLAEEGGGGRLFYYDRKWEEFDAALTWLRQQSRPGDVIATVAPHWTYLHTGRKAVMPPLEADPSRAQELLDSVPVAYLLVDDLEFLDVSRRYAAPVVEEHPLQWRLAYTSPGGHTSVYERVR